MKARHLCIAAAALVGGVLGMVLPAGGSAQNSVAQGNSQSIPQLPERPEDPTVVEPTVDDVERCLASGSCTTVEQTELGASSVKVVQDTAVAGELPDLHFVTSTEGAKPKVWSLTDEHGGSYVDLICGLTNCVLTLDVTMEQRVLLDMRINDGRLNGEIDGAAYTSSDDIYIFDLNDDGTLDAAIAEELWATPSGTPYYRTLVNSGRSLVTTGCTIPGEITALPVEPLTRTCPQL
ncbi:hypothetical protein EK0264_14960 [Epidermidibacterium keratini]|uniref:Uncharacterized protein n=1 Tax=Epidermidibacterium keratini TaxID=1891644 RepID=A0A7L4YQQ0_9ACTN|nr:hypothetical protein [Epidermidibacterium keratini]QHC01460.1 hypothetical protein EK0264_14960 [Epidermidibacterium keratini]